MVKKQRPLVDLGTAVGWVCVVVLIFLWSFEEEVRAILVKLGAQ